MLSASFDFSKSLMPLLTNSWKSFLPIFFHISTLIYFILQLIFFNKEIKTIISKTTTIILKKDNILKLSLFGKIVRVIMNIFVTLKIQIIPNKLYSRGALKNSYAIALLNRWKTMDLKIVLWQLRKYVQELSPEEQVLSLLLLRRFRSSNDF